MMMRGRQRDARGSCQLQLILGKPSDLAGKGQATLRLIFGRRRAAERPRAMLPGGSG